MSLSSTGIYGSTALLNSDLFTDLFQDIKDIKQDIEDISTNKIPNLILDISQNTVDISKNTVDISQSTFDISQNKADISKNRVDIRGVQLEWLDVTGMYPKYHRRVQISSLYPEEQRVCICFLLCSQIL